ncbi:MAG: hypothetical protein VKI82_10450 [Leptolyngbya sp.]|nr:hypothetical protein [Leptolyngbya sp.]
MAKGRGGIRYGQRVIAFLAMILVTWAMVGCAKPTEPTALLSEPTEAPHLLAGPMAEVSPPETLETLKQIIDAYTPQVRILSPRPGEVVESATVSVRFQVRGLPLFKDETWQLGPHLHVFLDDQPYQAVYDASEPLVLDNLAPGTHTLRVFASRPWHESFKNQGAFDQRTFHVFSPTPQNEVNASAPLLTYSRPQGAYGAEPIMLDFYLTNAPLHLSAQADAKDDLHDWRIRCTVNGQSFVFDQWQPIYLKGFQPGQNWVQLELIDETGRPIDNRFNNTVRIIDYQPGGTDTLSRLVRGELDLKAVLGILDPTYSPPTPAVIDDVELEVEDREPAPVPETPAPPIQPSATEADRKAVPLPAADPNESDPNAVDLDAPSLEEADLNASDLDMAEPETPDLAPSEPGEPEEAAPAIPMPVPTEDTVPASEQDIEAVEETVDDESIPEPALEPALDPDPVASPGRESAVIPDSSPVEATPSPSVQTQTQPSQGQTQSSQSPMERGKGMVKRWKNWAQQQTLPGFGTAQPEPPPAPIPVYEVPEVPATTASPEESTPSEASPNKADDPTMVMPEMIEPYLTQPYMTEPRLDFQPLDPDQGDSDLSEPSDQEEAPTSNQDTPPDPPQPDRSKRPYI